MKKTFCANCKKEKAKDEHFLRLVVGTWQDKKLFCCENCHKEYMQKQKQPVNHLCITCDKEFYSDNPKQISKHGYSPVCDNCYSKRISTTI